MPADETGSRKQSIHSLKSSVEGEDSEKVGKSGGQNADSGPLVKMTEDSEDLMRPVTGLPKRILTNVIGPEDTKYYDQVNIRGRLFYDGKPLNEVVKGKKNFRHPAYRITDYSNDGIVHDPRFRYFEKTAAYEIRGLLRGYFTFTISCSFGDKPFYFLESQTAIKITEKTTRVTTKDIHLQRMIGNLVYDKKCLIKEPVESYYPKEVTSPVLISWDEEGKNRAYDYYVYCYYKKKDCKPEEYRGTFAVGTITQPRLKLELPLSKPLEYYKLDMRIRSRGVQIGSSYDFSHNNLFRIVK